MINRDEALLEELTELIRRIETSVAGKSLADVLADADCYDANTFRLAAIGETSARLSDDLKARHGELNWRAMVAFRNVVSHDYFGVAEDYVWAALHDLGRIKSMCEQELERIRRDG